MCCDCHGRSLAPPCAAENRRPCYSAVSWRRTHMLRRISTARPAGRWRRGCCASGCPLLWPDLRGQSVLGIGFAAPYLRLWREQAARCIALTPAQMGAARWPVGSPNLSCTAEEDALPFPDLLVRPDPARARSGGGGKRAPAAAGDLAGAEGRRSAADRRTEPQRHVGLSGEHAVRSRPALFVRPDRSAAGRPRCIASSGGIPLFICRRRTGASSCAAPICSSEPGGSGSLDLPA